MHKVIMNPAGLLISFLFVLRSKEAFIQRGQDILSFKHTHEKYGTGEKPNQKADTILPAYPFHRLLLIIKVL